MPFDRFLYAKPLRGAPRRPRSVSKVAAGTEGTMTAPSPASAPSAARPSPPAPAAPSRPAPAPVAAAPDPARIAAIVGHVEAIGRAQLAQHLADHTAMPLGAAVALMRASARDGSPLAAAYQAAATTRAARGLAPDPQADRRIAMGVDAALSNGSPVAGLQSSPAPDHDSFTTDYKEGRRAAAALLGKHL